jgi:hypothetical protein
MALTAGRLVMIMPKPWKSSAVRIERSSQALDGTVGGDETLSLITRAYERFLEHAHRITDDSGCGCPPCSLLPGLGLKFVLRHGEYAIDRIAGLPELVGAEVILVTGCSRTRWVHSGATATTCSSRSNGHEPLVSSWRT